MRWMLLVDTCGTQGSVGLADLNHTPVIAAERTLPGRETQERLMSAITEVFAKVTLPCHELDVLAVVTGPGSFTGIRIGMAAVKGLAEGLGKPVLAVSRLAVLAAQAETLGITQAWIDAGRGDVFVGRYQCDTCVGECMLPGASATAQAAHAREPVIVMEEQLCLLYPAATLVPPVGVRQALPLAVTNLRAGAFMDAALMDANYLRVPDAEYARQRAGGGLQATLGAHL